MLENSQANIIENDSELHFTVLYLAESLIGTYDLYNEKKRRRTIRNYRSLPRT